MTQLLYTLASVALGIAYLLLPKYLVARVESAAKGAVDEQVGKSLAEHSHELAKQLEEHRHALQRNADALRHELDYQRERFSHDYSLFARRRNEVYAEIYSHLQRTHGLYAPHFSILTFKLTFDGASATNLLAFADRETGLNEGEREELRALVPRNLQAASRLATELNDRASIRTASRSFTEFKNATVLHSLYISPEVEHLLQEAAHAIARLSVRADEKREGEHINYEERQALLNKVSAICDQVRQQMAHEIRAGFTRAEPV